MTAIARGAFSLPAFRNFLDMQCENFNGSTSKRHLSQCASALRVKDVSSLDKANSHGWNSLLLRLYIHG